MMKRMMMFITLFAMLFVSVSATAQPRRHMQGQRQRMEAHKKQGFEALELSKEQKEKLNEIRMAARKQGIELRAKKQLAGLEMQELMAAELPDKSKINAKISEISKINETAMKNRVESMLAVREVLTPEQREKAKEMHLFSPRHGQRRQLHPGMRGQGGQFRRGGQKPGGFGGQGAFLDEGIFDDFEI